MLLMQKRFGVPSGGVFEQPPKLSGREHLVKETLGHESLATTSKYTHTRPDDSSAQYLAVWS